MTKNTDKAYAANKLVFEAAVSMIKLLDKSSAILGRTDQVLLLRTNKIPSILYEEIMDSHLKLYQTGEEDFCFISVFPSTITNDRATLITFHVLTVPLPFQTKIPMNEVYPFVEETRSLILKVPTLTDEHVAEMEFLLESTRDERERKWAQFDPHAAQEAIESEIQSGGSTPRRTLNS